MKTFYRFFWIVPVIFVAACGTAEQAKDKTDLYDKKIIPIEEGTNDKLMAEVMEIHDEVMPEMGSIRRMRKALLNKLETTTDDAVGKILQDQADKLDESHEAMMMWMRQFNPNQDASVTDSSYHVYLQDQKEKMIEVRDLMVNALQEGEVLLGSGD